MSYQYPIELMLLHKRAYRPVLVTFLMAKTQLAEYETA